jgi:hypothetical protein
MMRLALISLMFCGAVATGCDPMAYASFSVAPRAAVDRPADASAQAALEMVARIAQRGGLKRATTLNAEGRNPQGWLQCFTLETTWLCGRLRGDTIEYEMRQWLTNKLSPSAESLRRELVDSLSARFGADRVRSGRGGLR